MLVSGRAKVFQNTIALLSGVDMCFAARFFDWEPGAFEESGGMLLIQLYTNCSPVANEMISPCQPCILKPSYDKV